MYIDTHSYLIAHTQIHSPPHTPTNTQIQRFCFGSYSLGIIELASKRVNTTSHLSSVQLRQLLLMSLAAYYEKLSEVFGRSGYKNLHALALLRWLAHTKQHNKSVSPENYSVLASVAVLAVLAVPLSYKSVS